jgi:hypothetical protein
LSTQIEPTGWQPVLRAPGAADQIAAAPDRMRRLMIECVGLIERELPFEVLPTLRWLQRDLDSALDSAGDDGAARERLKEARLACWKHLEACACHGVGTEVHAVRALLTTLETLSDAPTTAQLNEVLRLVQSAGAETAVLAERLSNVLGSAQIEANSATEQAE